MNWLRVLRKCYVFVLMSFKMRCKNPRRNSRFISMVLLLSLISTIGIGAIFCWAQFMDAESNEEEMIKKALYWVDILRRENSTQVRQAVFKCGILGLIFYGLVDCQRLRGPSWV